MIDKEKTIRKALAKYGKIRPIIGKSSLDECFFAFRGDIMFQFRTTEDKKLHCMKAVPMRTQGPQVAIQWSFFSSLGKMLTEPVKLGTLIGKKS